MQDFSEDFGYLWYYEHKAVTKAVFNEGDENIEFTVNSEDIISVKTEGALFAQNAFGFGGCVSRQFEMTFYPPTGAVIPRMAKVHLYMCLTNGDTSSEWLSKGIFYIDTRKTEYNGKMTITGYDAMLKAEAEYFQNESSAAPTMETVASNIATSIGVTLDSRSSFISSYTCPPLEGYSMREILGFIAVAHGGNFVITDVGELRLIRETDNGTVYTLTNKTVFTFDESETYAPITKIVLWIDNNNSFTATAAEDNGRTIELICPYATQDMANALLSQLSVITYTPYKSKALLHPACEIGDKFLYGNKSYFVATQTQTFSSAFSSELEAPGEEEIDHEYPFETVQERQANREIASKAGKTGGSEGFDYSLTDNGFEITSDGVPVFKANESGAKIGAWSISNDGLGYNGSGGNAHLDPSSLYMADGYGFFEATSSKVEISEVAAPFTDQNHVVRNLFASCAGTFITYDLYNSKVDGTEESHFFVGTNVYGITNTNIRFTTEFLGYPQTRIPMITGTYATLQGTWYGTSSQIIASARSLKKDISDFDARHDILFDNLKPRTFEYIEGESGRTHYGFILDELKDAMDAAGINTEECGAYCLIDKNKQDGDGGIRYEELIALNTYEIQMLKKRIAELEEALKEKEETEEIQNNENSQTA